MNFFRINYEKVHNLKQPQQSLGKGTIHFFKIDYEKKTMKSFVFPDIVAPTFRN